MTLPTADRPLEKIAEINRRLSETTVDPTMWPSIIDGLPDGLIVISELGRIHLVNAQIELIFGYHRSKLVGEPVNMLLEPGAAVKHTAHTAHIERFFACPTARPMTIARHLHGRHASGRVLTLQISIGPLIAESGVFGLAVVRRVTGGG